MKMSNHILNINTILHTKDGSKIGNAIVTGRDGYYWEVTTDYGNKLKLTSEEIYECFNIAWSNVSEEIDGFSCQEMQEMMSADHKHRASNFKINENNIIEAIGIVEKVIEILDKKCRKGCTNHTWIGFQNGNGTECGVDIERLIKKAKQIKKHGKKFDEWLEKDHPCFEHGHAFYLVCEIDNGRSKYGEHQCSRCGHIEPFQYDYKI